MRPIFASAIMTVLMLYPTGSAISQSDKTCVQYMEIDYEYHKSKKNRKCEKGCYKSAKDQCKNECKQEVKDEEFIDQEVMAMVKRRCLSNCSKAVQLDQCYSNCEDLRNARREIAYRIAYKGPVSKYPEITKKLRRAERRRCRKRGFR